MSVAVAIASGARLCGNVVVWRTKTDLIDDTRPRLREGVIAQLGEAVGHRLSCDPPEHCYTYSYEYSNSSNHSARGGRRLRRE